MRPASGGQAQKPVAREVQVVARDAELCVKRKASNAPTAAKNSPGLTGRQSFAPSCPQNSAGQ